MSPSGGARPRRTDSCRGADPRIRRAEPPLPAAICPTP
ncbi:hypothetical protein D516_2127 [Rhodobacter sp. AKP1]|nr:hypothetical protein D516_2127 [Rhodobacter sp. AKP1]